MAAEQTHWQTSRPKKSPKEFYMGEQAEEEKCLYLYCSEYSYTYAHPYRPEYCHSVVTSQFCTHCSYLQSNLMQFSRLLHFSSSELSPSLVNISCHNGSWVQSFNQIGTKANCVCIGIFIIGQSQTEMLFVHTNDVCPSQQHLKLKHHWCFSTHGHEQHVYLDNYICDHT